MRLECQHVSHTYETATAAICTLEDVSFSVNTREFVSLVGPSGCGKTTLLKVIAGLLRPTSGQIAMSGSTTTGRPPCALVFQDHGLFPWLTVLHNVAFGLEMQGMERQERLERAHTFIGRVGLSRFAHFYPHQLSIGMQQRVGIARAFVTDPEVLLMDEPFGALDSQTRIVLQEELLRLWNTHRKVVVFVTHDIDEAVRLSDRVLVMTGRPGRVREEILVPLPRPRDLSREASAAISEMKWHIWALLEDEVRKGSWITN
jgi:NitT/TauT family transport system ATP-binding protein